MGLIHASLTPGESVQAARPEGHSVKRSYVPIKPAFRPLLPKPVTRDTSPSTGIQIHTRATLNAGRKRLVTSKPVDLKRRRPSPAQSPVASPASAASPKPTSPVAIAKPKVNNMNLKSTGVSAAPTSPPMNTTGISNSDKSSSLPIDINKLPVDWTNDAFVSPPTPASLGESPRGINMASLIDSNPSSAIDPVYMVADNGFEQFPGLTLVPASNLSSADEQWNMSDLVPINDGANLQLSPDFTGEFDDLSEFYFRESNGAIPPPESVSDVVSNFMETQLDASLPVDEKINSEMAIMDYFVPANELF